MFKFYAVYKRNDWILPYWAVDEVQLLTYDIDGKNIQVTVGSEIYTIDRHGMFTNLDEARLEADKRNLSNTELITIYNTLSKLLKR